MKNMMKKIATAVALTSMLATPVFAGKFNLKEYKTVGVAPVLSASNTRGQFEATLAAQASTFTYAQDKADVTKKAASKGLETSGFGFAGKAGGGDVALLILGSTLGMLPAAMKLDAATAKNNATQIQALMPKLEGRVNGDVLKAVGIALTAIQGDDFQTALKALLVAMALSADSIKKGNERAHGYMATGLYAGLSATWAAAGQQNTAYAELAAPLVMLLEEDASMGGADRQVAAQLKIVGAEMAAGSPSLDKVVSAIGAMQAVKPD